MALRNTLHDIIFNHWCKVIVTELQLHAALSKISCSITDVRPLSPSKLGPEGNGRQSQTGHIATTTPTIHVGNWFIIRDGFFILSPFRSQKVVMRSLSLLTQSRMQSWWNAREQFCEQMATSPRSYSTLQMVHSLEKGEISCGSNVDGGARHRRHFPPLFCQKSTLDAPLYTNLHQNNSNTIKLVCEIRRDHCN